MNEMTITSAQYVSDSNDDTIEAIIDGQTLFVPVDNGNRHYVAILAWVAEGNTIADAD
jgi:hypothetical protein